VVHALNQELLDCIHDNADEDAPVASDREEKVDSMVAEAAVDVVVAVVVVVVVVVVVAVVVAAAAVFVVVAVVDVGVAAVAVAVRKQLHCCHDRMDMHLPVRNNLYFQKNHYTEFFCIKSLYLLLTVDEWD
jgi:hypothetical protein